jgi:hypothetical protein
MFVCGGFDPTIRSNVATALVYNSSTDAIEPFPDMLLARRCHASVLVRGVVMIFGGSDEIKEAEMAVVASQGQARLPNMPIEGDAASAVHHGQTILLSGFKFPSVLNYNYQTQVYSWTRCSLHKSPLNNLISTGTQLFLLNGKTLTELDRNNLKQIGQNGVGTRDWIFGTVIVDSVVYCQGYKGVIYKFCTDDIAKAERVHVKMLTNRAQAHN